METTDPFKFNEVEQYSDTDSIHSVDDVDISLDDWRFSLNSFDSFSYIQYVLRKEEYNTIYSDNEIFVNTVITALSSQRCVTAVRFLADIHDLDNGDNIRWSQNIRFEIDNFENLNELKDCILDHLNNESAPVWHRLLTDESSDKGYNKLVKYHKDYFDFCIQSANKSRIQMTTVSGETEIHPGVFVKVVTDHGIVYSSNDCLIQCLNEALNKRIDPKYVREKIWGKIVYKDLHTPRHIRVIAKIFDVHLKISDIIDCKKYVFNTTADKIVNLVKVGKIIGILDRIDYTVDKRNIPNNVVYFDLETVGNNQRVYAYTWRAKNGDETVCHNNFDDVEERFVQKIITTLECCSDNDTIIAYSWNGSKFDNWITFNILKRKYNKKLWIHDIIINSANELLTFKLTIGIDDSRKVNIVFRDPKKLFNVSMPEACEVFGINDAKHEFDHNIVDEHYINDTFDNYIKENRNKILDYVRQDGVLLEQITNCIKEVYDKENINIYSTLTRSVASSILWQKTIEQYKILKDVTLSPYAEICGIKYNDIMDDAIGGRTQCIQRGVFKNVCGIDVNSMYPYICANNLYPCGEINEWKPGTEVPKDKLGIYYVHIKRQSYPNVIPHKKSKYSAYDWNSNKCFKKWITNIDMLQLDEFEVLKGFFWVDTTDKFYKTFMIDNYNERCSIDKSDPRNLHIKLKMNSVTGSVFQHSFRELIMVMKKESFIQNVKKYSDLVKIIGFESLNDNEYIVTMRPISLREDDPKIKAQKEFCKGAITQKPWVLTMFTYSYARRMLREEWLKLENSGCKIVYCDTDSLFFTNENNVINRKEYFCENKELGKWSIECWNDEGAFYTPKVYGIKNIGKLRIKGVSYNSFIVNSNYENKDLDYNRKTKLFLDAANENAKKPSYKNVVDLCNGISLKTINFIMKRSKDKGITKDYVIKVIK